MSRFIKLIWAKIIGMIYYDPIMPHIEQQRPDAETRFTSTVAELKGHEVGKTIFATAPWHRSVTVVPSSSIPGTCIEVFNSDELSETDFQHFFPGICISCLPHVSVWTEEGCVLCVSGQQATDYIKNEFSKSAQVGR